MSSHNNKVDKKKAVTQIIKVIEQVKNSFSNEQLKRDIHYVIYLDNFDIASDALTNDHKAVMDGWTAGNQVGNFPFLLNNPNHDIVLIVGMTSQTGSDAANDALGKDRAQKVYDYLSSRLPASQLNNAVETVGATRPNINSPGEELGVNRAVGVILRVKTFIIGVGNLPTPPPQQPPEPKSRHWALSVSHSEGFGLDPIPGINVLGVLEIHGILRNVRTGEERSYTIIVGGLDLSVGLSTPIEIAVNLQSDLFTPFNTHWVDFDDFDNTTVFVGALAAANVVEVYNDTAIGFVELNTQVVPQGITIKSTAIGAGVQMQFGIMMLDN